MPTLSVIVPVYNAEAYLVTCIKSILNQTLKDLELLLIDDESTDKSPQICEQFAHYDRRVRVIHQANSGAAAARNRGLELASGSYITFVDSDDYIDPDMYEKMLSIILDYKCDLAICDCLKEFDSGPEIYTHALPSGFYDRAKMKSEYFPQLLMTESVEYPVTISNCLLLIRKDVIETHHIRYPEGIRFSEDLLFGAEVGYAAGSMYYMKEYTPYHYRQNPMSVTHSAYRDKWPMLLDLYRRIKNSFEQKNDFDFGPQIDRCLLFFVYLAIGNLESSELKPSVRRDRIREVLKNNIVHNMLKRIQISRLEISWKLKLITYLYRWKCIHFIELLRWYQNKKKRYEKNPIY